MPNSATAGSSSALDRTPTRLDRWHDGARDLAARHPNAVRGLTASAVLLVVFAGWFLYQVFAGLPGKDQLRELGNTAEGTTVFDAYDRPVFSLPTQYRVEVELARMSQHLRDAVIAVEDTRFYEHDGIDGVRVVSAA